MQYPFRPRNKRTGGFTLIELLVVVSIIVILIAMLVPALERAIRQTKVAVCASHMAGWGRGSVTYAVGNDQNFPDNRGGWDTSWVSPTMLKFFADYLAPYSLTDENLILDCPTQVYHNGYRAAHRPGRSNDGVYRAPTVTTPGGPPPPDGTPDEVPDPPPSYRTGGWSYDSRPDGDVHWSELEQGLVGYFILPARIPNVTDARALGTHPEGELWLARYKMGQGPSQAPLMADMKQSWSPTGNYDASEDNWYWQPGKPYSSHTDSGGIPVGGNFLYEGGHVIWEPTDRMQLGYGQAGAGWRYWYRPLSAVPANAP